MGSEKAAVLDELNETTRALSSAIEQNQVEEAWGLLERRGELAQKLAEHGPLTPDERSILQSALTGGREVILTLSTKRHWLSTSLADARAHKASQRNLRPYRETKGLRLNVTS